MYFGCNCSSNVIVLRPYSVSGLAKWPFVLADKPRFVHKSSVVVYIVALKTGSSGKSTAYLEKTKNTLNNLNFLRRVAPALLVFDIGALTIKLNTS